MMVGVGRNARGVVWSTSLTCRTPARRVRKRRRIIFGLSGPFGTLSPMTRWCAAAASCQFCLLLWTVRSARERESASGGDAEGPSALLEVSGDDWGWQEWRMVLKRIEIYFLVLKKFV